MLQLDISDPGSGVETKGLSISSLGGRGTGKFIVTPQNLVRTSGDEKKGRYEAVVTFPSWIEPGDWYFLGEIRDKAGNRYAGGDDAYSSIGAWVDVKSMEDFTQPSISGSISETMLDISDGSASLIARATLRDAEAGFDLTNLSSITLGGVNPKFISIRKNEIQIEQKITFAQFNPDNPSRGEISVMVGGVKDLVGNVPSGWRADLCYIPGAGVYLCQGQLCDRL